MDRSMREAREAYRRWKRVAAVFFRAPAPPSALETEEFARRVMDRLKPREQPTEGFHWPWMDIRWLLPACGFAAVALISSVILSGRDSTPMDVQLAAAGRDYVMAEWALQREPSEPADILSSVMEEP